MWDDEMVFKSIIIFYILLGIEFLSTCKIDLMRMP